MTPSPKPAIRPQAVDPQPSSLRPFFYGELVESYDQEADTDRVGARVKVLRELRDGTLEDTGIVVSHCYHWVCDPPVLDECTRVVICRKDADHPVHRIWMWECQ